MPFGSFLAKKLTAATRTSLNAARSVAQWGVDKVVAGFDAAKRGVSRVWEGTKGAVGDVAGTLKAGSQKVGAAKTALSERISNAVQAVFGDAVPQGPADAAVQACPVAEAQRKQQTREERNKLIESGKQSSDPQVQQRADELQRDMDAVEDAKLSDHIYCVHDPAECQPGNSTVTGFKDVSNDAEVLDKLGLQKEDLSIPGSNFRAAVFERQTPPFGKDEAGYVVVFKGTSSGNVEDWRNNFRQGINAASPYYKQAVGIGKNVAEGVGSPPKPKVVFAGHSLGGGLASAAAGAAGLPANTFNAAGLNEATITRYGGVPHDQTSSTRAYNVPGDPLTKANTEGVGAGRIPDAAGTSDRVELALSDRTPAAGSGDTYFHSMPVVVRAIERRKKANEDALSTANEQ